MCLFRFPENCTCVNLPAVSSKFTHQYYNHILPRISYFFIYSKLHFDGKNYWKRVVINLSYIWDSISRYVKLFYTLIHINQPQIKRSRILQFYLQFFTYIALKSQIEKTFKTLTDCKLIIENGFHHALIPPN